MNTDAMHTLASDIERAASPALAACHRLTLPAQQPPWTRTGIRLDRGQSYTLLAAGRVLWSARHPHLYGGPGFHLWARVSPGGRIVNLTRDSGSFTNGSNFNVTNSIPEVYTFVFFADSIFWLGGLNNSSEDPVVGFSPLTLTPVAVPEPSTCAMALAGLACGGFSMFRRRLAR